MITAEQARDVKYATTVAILKELELRILTAVVHDNQIALAYWVKDKYKKVLPSVTQELENLGYAVEVKEIDDTTFLNIKWSDVN